MPESLKETQMICRSIDVISIDYASELLKYIILVRERERERERKEKNEYCRTRNPLSCLRITVPLVVGVKF